MDKIKDKFLSKKKKLYKLLKYHSNSHEKSTNILYLQKSL